MKCKKRVEGQEYVCDHCGTRWGFDDTNDCPHEKVPAFIKPVPKPVTSRKEMIAVLAEQCVRVRVFRERGYQYFIAICEDGTKQTIGVYMVGEKREWDLMTKQALRFCK